MSLRRVVFIAALAALATGRAAAAAADEFRVKREEVFEFARQPAVTRDGGRAVVSFETRGLLYVGEGSFHFQQAVVIDPVTGRTRIEQLPFDAEDMCFDNAGLAYLRTPTLVVRYDPMAGWREVPWDYGETRQHVTYNSNSGRREARVVSGLALPSNSGWHRGGVGWHGKNHGLGCGCRNTRFALDGFGRVFAPEIDRYNVAVLDTAGNVILRLGRYGNVDDGRPTVRNAERGMRSGEKRETIGIPRSIGGDEVALMHAAYVAVHTDRRLPALLSGRRLAAGGWWCIIALSS